MAHTQKYHFPGLSEIILGQIKGIFGHSWFLFWKVNLQENVYANHSVLNPDLKAIVELKRN